MYSALLWHKKPHFSVIMSEIPPTSDATQGNPNVKEKKNTKPKPSYFEGSKNIFD